MSFNILITGASYSKDATRATRKAIIALPRNAVNCKAERFKKKLKCTVKVQIYSQSVRVEGEMVPPFGTT